MPLPINLGLSTLVLVHFGNLMKLVGPLDETLMNAAWNPILDGRGRANPAGYEHGDGIPILIDESLIVRCHEQVLVVVKIGISVLVVYGIVVVGVGARGVIVVAGGTIGANRVIVNYRIVIVEILLDCGRCCRGLGCGVGRPILLFGVIIIIVNGIIIVIIIIINCIIVGKVLGSVVVLILVILDGVGILHDGIVVVRDSIRSPAPVPLPVGVFGANAAVILVVATIPAVLLGIFFVSNKHGIVAHFIRILRPCIDRIRSGRLLPNERGWTRSSPLRGQGATAATAAVGPAQSDAISQVDHGRKSRTD
mmetsp:Transcript_14028/g.30074  ORF Transcript_14028/g.30074 Transcript_14028/m.30074 type:complete len:308 (-) Transcript_14028:687-1610(-)